MSESIIAHLKASSRKLAGATPLDVTINDGSGNPITSFGGSGGTSSSFGSTFPATGTAAGAIDSGGNMAGLNLDASGNLKVSGSITASAPAAGTATLSNIAATAVNATLLAANSLRLSFQIYNDSTSSVYIKLGATASATSYTKRLLPNEYWSTRDLGVNYTGRIDAIWDSATGTMRVTELTA